MSKVKLGDRPKSFPHTLKFPMLDGTEGVIPVSYKYRTRSEFAAFWDTITASTDKAVAAEVAGTEEGKRSLAQMFAKASRKNAQDVLEMLDSWGLDADLSIDSVMQLNDELPQAVATLVGDYYTALTTGRLGN